MKLFALSVSLDLLGVVFLSVWLWVLLRRRDLWLRYTAKEAALYSRLHLPQWFIAASRRFEEGRGMFYFVVAALVLCSLLLVLSSGMWIRTALTKSSRSMTPPRITVTMDSNGVPRLAGVPLSDTNLRNGAFAAMGAMGIKAGLNVSAISNGNPQVTNAINTLEAMRRAGLLKTSTNYVPGSFE